jgi:glutamine synthetase
MYSRDPRYIARKAELYLKQTGIADTSFWGPECEFYIFDSIRFEQNEHEGYYHIDAVEGVWNSGAEEDGKNLGYKPRYKEGYFPLPPMDHYQDLRSEMVLNLEKVGIEIEVHHHEVGTAGQAEIDMRYDTLLKTADNVMKYKYVVKNTARKNGKTVDVHAEAALHGQRLGHAHPPEPVEERREPVLGRGRLRGISDMGPWYIGGLLAHAPALLAFSNPTTNSYRRLVPGYEAPINLVYSQRNRSACVRIPLYLQDAGGEAAGVPDARPVVQPVPRVRGDAPGRDGRDQEQDRAAGADGQGPLRPPARGEGERQAGPGSLEEVLDALENDHQFLLEGGVFTQDVIDTGSSTSGSTSSMRSGCAASVRVPPVLRHLV